MLLFDSIGQAMRMLRAQKMRAALTLFGFVWGTASVIFLVGWGDGVRHMLEEGFAKTGRNMGTAGAGFITADFAPASDRRFLWIDNEDVEVLRRRARRSELIAAETQTFLPAMFGQNVYTVDLRGMEPETMDIRGVGVAAGRRITRTDLLHERRVVILGDGMRRKLLGSKGSIDSTVRIGGVPFRVIGFLEPVGVQLNRDGNVIDDQAWIPLHTYQKHWPAFWTEERVVDHVLYRMKDPERYEAARDEVRSILAARLGVPASDRGAIWGYSAVEMLNKLQIGRTRSLMFIIAVTTLVIGGIGVLTMMLDAVHERRSEIGVRLSVGARRRDVLLQFFLESLAVSLLGGVAGLMLGIGGCLGLAALDVPDLVPVPRLSLQVVVVTTLIMISIGLLAGLVPAWRATTVDPAETLRAG